VEVEPSIKENLVTWSIPVTLLLDAVGKPILVKTVFEGNMDKTGDVTSQHGIKKLLAKNQYSEAMTTYKALVKIPGEMHPKILSMIKNAKSTQTADTTKTEPSFLFIRSQIANFREEPSLSSNKIGQLKQNTKVEKLSTEGEWFEIKIKNKIAWLHESVVSEAPLEKRDEVELIHPVNGDGKMELERQRGKSKAMNEENGGPKEVKKRIDEVAAITFSDRESLSEFASSPSSKSDDVEQYTKAKIKFDNGNYKEAREDFKQFLEVFPNSKHAQDAKYWFAETYYKEGAYKKAIIEYEKMIFRFPPGK
jgi:TolA-binding protein